MKPFEYYFSGSFMAPGTVYNQMLFDLGENHNYYLLGYPSVYPSCDIIKDSGNGGEVVFTFEKAKQLYDWCVEEELKYKLTLLVDNK
jgi:hypothetical protein